MDTLIPSQMSDVINTPYNCDDFWKGSKACTCHKCPAWWNVYCRQDCHLKNTQTW